MHAALLTRLAPSPHRRFIVTNLRRASQTCWFYKGTCHWVCFGQAFLSKAPLPTGPLGHQTGTQGAASQSGGRHGGPGPLPETRQMGAEGTSDLLKCVWYGCFHVGVLPFALSLLCLICCLMCAYDRLDHFTPWEHFVVSHVVCDLIYSVCQMLVLQYLTTYHEICKSHCIMVIW